MIFGCGYVGSALAERLLESGVRVGALTRNAEKAARLRAMGLHEVLVAELQSPAWSRELKGSYEAVVNCVSSAGGGLEGYRASYLEGQRAILAWAKGRQLSATVYTSSTSVYPQDGGVWVDEASPTEAAPPTGRIIRESEMLLQAAGTELGGTFILRLAGIYGPGRHYLINQVREGAGEIPGSGDYALNMIHRDDAVGAILAALAQRERADAGIYNIADDAPATKAEVVAWLAQKLGLAPPEFRPDLISDRLKRRGGRMPHRFVSNAKARSALSWRPRYPSFREGYASLIEEAAE
jgi:nucleoside-diphosphate-sugar epimerase